MMIENIINIVQIIVTCGCLVVAVFKAVEKKSRIWMLYGMFCAAFFLGDLWWELATIFYPETPDSFIPYLSWDAAALFLIVMMLQFKPEPGITFQKKCFSMIWTVLFVTVMCAIYMQYGSYFNNTLTAILMGAIIWFSTMRIYNVPKEDRPSLKRNIASAILFYCVAEYALWTSSCFSYNENALNVYDVLDLVLTASVVAFIPAIGKAEGR